MVDPNKLAKLRELYTEYKALKPQPYPYKGALIYPTPPPEIGAKIMDISDEIDDLLWDLLPEIVA